MPTFNNWGADEFTDAQLQYASFHQKTMLGFYLTRSNTEDHLMIATCPERELLRRYCIGMVSEEQADEITSHLRECPSCQSWLANAKDLDDTLVGQLRHSTVDESFELEPQCKSAMAIALGALAAAGQEVEENGIDLPSSIGDYEIVRSIGRGGMGNVYLAQHTKLDRTVAVKVLASNRLSDPRMHDRFEKEMRAIGSLSHPNIVTAHDARDVDGVALLVTEWIDGLDLKDILSRTGPLSVANACEIGAHVAQALSYIAEQSLVHRDLKPSNVMINREGEVKLLDLGLARLRGGEAEEVSGATATGQAMGTADYVAPEQIIDAREVDIRADIYGLGCTLYKLLSGNAPFESDRHATAFAKLTAHVSEQPAPLRIVAPQVPPPVASLVDQMLAKSPEDRPATPEVILTVLQKHSSGGDLKSLVHTAIATEPSPLTKQVTAAPVTTARQPIWKRRVPIAVAVASGLGGLILGWLAGVTITIIHPDGSKTTIDTPKTSDVVIHENGDVDVALPGSPVAEQTAMPLLVDPAHQSRSDVIPNFDGVWKAISVQRIGNDLSPTQKVDNVSFAIHGNQYVLFQDSRPVASGTYTAVAPNLITLMQGQDPAVEVNVGRYHIDPTGSLLLNFAEPVGPEGSEADRMNYALLFSRLLGPEKFQSGLPFFKVTGIPDLRPAAHAYTQLRDGVPLRAIALSRPEDRPRFEGIWAATSGMHRGSNAPIPTTDDVAILFHDHHFILVRRSRLVMGGTFELDSDLSRIILKSLGTPTATSYRGVYRFRTDGQLGLCLHAADSDEFPIAFDAPRNANSSSVQFWKVDPPPTTDPTALPPYLKEDPSRNVPFWVNLYAKMQSGGSIEALLHDALAVSGDFNVGQSRQNLKQLAIAFHNYHDTYQAFPKSKGSPATRKLTEGEYPCSWRVAILPFIQQQQLYQQYNFKEPWDSEGNLKLLDKMPDTYRRPGDPADSSETGYVGFVGENTILGDGEPKKIRDVIDGTSNTVMLAEAVTDIPWTKPEDISLDDLAGTGLLDMESLLVALADGSVRELKPVTPELIKGVATINDGKYFKDKDIDDPLGYSRNPHR